MGVVLAATIGFSFLHSQSATAAASAGTITLSPPLKEVTFGPGILQTTVPISLTNNTDHNFSGQLKLVDFTSLDEHGGITFEQAGVPIEKYGLANWMSLPAGNSLSLAPGQSTKLNLVLQNRDDLTPGGHYGAVVITASSGQGSGSSIGLNQQLVSLIFLKKLGGIHYGLALRSMKAEGSGIPTTVDLRFTSTGNVFVVPRGYITVTDPAGKLVAKGIIDPDSSFVMQGTTRLFVTIMQPIADSKLTGKYTITAYYRYDGSNTYSQKSIYVTRGSLPSVVIIIGTLTVVILLLTMYITHRKSHKRYRQIYQ